MITLENVTKVYQTKSGPITAMDDVNLQIKEGEIFGIIGYSGAGKSTLIRTLNGLERPTAGTIHVAGRNITNISGKALRQVRQEIGMIFQHFNLLWSRTVLENITFPLEIAGVPRRNRVQKAKELIKLVGLEGRENAYPSQLSGGQKQRVGIARALANQPKVLLCDEATSALDPETTDSILDLLAKINREFGLTIVIITHEMHVIRKICHRVAVMEEGKIVESGPVMEVFKNPKKEITRRFIGQAMINPDPKPGLDHLIEKYSSGIIVKCIFTGEVAEEPVIANMLRAVPVSVNILQGNISQTQDGSYGTLIVHLDGEEETIKEAIDYLQHHHVGVEVVKNV